jgi:urea transport system substrate-binding protein
MQAVKLKKTNVAIKAMKKLEKCKKESFLLNKAYKKLTQKTLYVCCLYSKTGVLGSAPYDNYDILLKFFDYGLKKYNCNVNIIPLYKDLGDDLDNFSKWIEECVQKYDVKYCFGCWRSSERKHVIPVLTKYKLRLFYPLQYEGMEAANSIYYFGATPNQQIFPGLEYIFRHFYYYDDFYIVGSDYIYPQTVIELVKTFLKVQYPNKKLIYTKLFPLDATDFSEFINTVFKKSPNGAIILNLINGKSFYDYSKQFYETYYSINPKIDINFVEGVENAKKVLNTIGKNDEILSIYRRYPSISTSIFENDINPEYIKYIKESFTVSNFASQILDEEIYFPNKGYIHSEQDYQQLKKYQKKQGRPIGDSQYNSILSAYFFIKILKKIIDNNRNIYEVEDFDKEAKGTNIFGICGPHDMVINTHITKLFYILKIFDDIDDTRFKIIYDSYNILSPAPHLYAADKIIYVNSFDVSVNILNRMYS